MTLLEKAIAKAVVEKEGRKTLSCGDALAIASGLQIGSEKVGQFCNEHKIKIVSCKLGCFK